MTERLAAEDPLLTTFSTLSPVPGFAAWLKEHAPDTDTDDRAIMQQRCADYLLTARRRNLPADPVARFHLRNGACVAQINWQGDTSPKGMAESHGLLVNYRYSGQDLAANNDALTLDGLVTVTPEVAALASVTDLSALVRITHN